VLPFFPLLPSKCNYNDIFSLCFSLSPFLFSNFDKDLIGVTLPKIITEDFDEKNKLMCDLLYDMSPDHRLEDISDSSQSSFVTKSQMDSNLSSVLRRSHSGPHGEALNQNKNSSKLLDFSPSHRARRQSGDDSLFEPSKSHNVNSNLFDAFRSRSKSECKSKRPNIISTLRHSVHLPWPSDKKHSHCQTGLHSPNINHLDPCSNYVVPERSYSRSSSSVSSGSGPVARVMDMFRYRSHSITTGSESRHKVSYNKFIV